MKKEFEGNYVTQDVEGRYVLVELRSGKDLKGVCTRIMYTPDT